MKYFYCQSYQIFNLALYYQTIQRDEVCVITSDQNIIEACDFLNINKLEHKQFMLGDYVWKLNSVKREITRLCKKLEESDFHYSHTQSALFCFLLLHNSNFHAKKIFHDFEVVYNKANLLFGFKPIVRYSRLLILNFLIRLLFRNTPLVIRSASLGSYILGMDLNYIYKNSSIVNYGHSDYYYMCLKLFKSIHLDYEPIENLYIAQNDVTSYDTKLKQKIFGIFTILKRNKAVVKTHPKFSLDIELESLQKLPSYLPVELFFNLVNGNVIGIRSASLITASHFNNFKTIALFKIAEDNDNDLINWQNQLKELGHELYQPTSLESFQALLES